MPDHLLTGKKGEDLAADWLCRRGFAILERNWRYRRAEVDIIAEKDGLLHFIEIKTRRSESFGLPEESLGRVKLENLMLAAEEYQELHPRWSRIQFDALAVSLAGDSVTYFFQEDIYL